MADGSLIFDTKIDTSGVDTGMLKVQNKMDKATNAVSRQTKAVQKLEAELSKLKTAQIPTEQYAKLEAAMQKADSRLMSLIDKQDKLLATGGSTSGAAWEKLQYDIEQTAAKVRAYQAQMAQMRSDGSAFTDDGLAVSELSAKLDTAKIKLQELTIKEQEAATALRAATSPRNPEALAKATNKASTAFANFGKRISAVVRSALIFTVITQILAKFRDYVGQTAVANTELRNALGRVKGALQSAFTPIFNAVIPALTALANSLATVITYIAQFISLLGGGGGKGGTAKLQSSTSSLASSSNSASAALEGEKVSLMGVKKAADDAEKSMAGFDEINQLSFNDKSGGGGSGAGGGAGEIPVITPEPVEMPTWLLETAERLSEAFDKISNSVSKIWTSLKKLKIPEAFSKTLLIVADVVGIVADTFGFLANLLTGDFKGAVESVIGMMDGLITTVEDWVLNNEMWEGLFGDSAVKYKAAAQKMFDDFRTGIMESDWSAFGEDIKNALVGIWIIIKANCQTGWEAVKIVFSNSWQAIVDWWNGSIAAWWNTNVAPWFTSEQWSPVWAAVKQWFVDGWESIVSWWNSSALVKWWKDHVAPWFTAKQWNDLWTTVKTGFELGWEAVKTWWNNTAIVQWWNNDVMPWFKAETWLEIMDGIKTAFSTAFTNAANAAIGIVNKLISWINSALSFDIPGFEFMGKSVSGVHLQLANISSIPYLAQGAVIPPNREFLAVLGDQKQGTNIEAPLSTLVEAFNMSLRQTGGAGRDITVILELDKTEFGRAVYKANNSETQRVGLRLAGAY